MKHAHNFYTVCGGTVEHKVSLETGNWEATKSGALGPFGFIRDAHTGMSGKFREGTFRSRQEA
jgi:hypothetical protein